MIDSCERDQDALFDHLTLLSDMRVEYEQQDILKTLYVQSPDKPTGIDVVGACTLFPSLYFFSFLSLYSFKSLSLLFFHSLSPIPDLSESDCIHDR